MTHNLNPETLEISQQNEKKQLETLRSCEKTQGFFHKKTDGHPTVTTHNDHRIQEVEAGGFTVDGSEILLCNQLRLVVNISLIYRGF